MEKSVLEGSMQIYGISKSLDHCLSPSSQGQTEILNQTIEVAIHAFINHNGDKWSQLLPYLTFTYNTTPHTATKFTPSYFLYRFHPCTSLTLLTNEPLIGQPNPYKFNAPDAQQFTEEIAAVRLVAKDALKLAQL